MRTKRALLVLALYAGWVLAGVFGAFALASAYAFAVDPHGDGPIGEGFGTAILLFCLIPVGMVAGYLRADLVRRKRWSRA
jgi:hypothetical protein